MKKLFVILFALFLSIAVPFANVAAESTVNTPPADVVYEHIRFWGEMYNVQKAIVKDTSIKKKDQTEQILNNIYFISKTILVLQTGKTALENMHVLPQFEEFRKATIFLYSEKIEILNVMRKILTEFARKTPKPGVDYSKLAAMLPQIRAQIDYLDTTLFEMTAWLGFILIDEKPDKEGHMSHLNISSEERQSLVKKIDSTFGNDLKTSKNYTVMSAFVLKEFLKGPHKSTDEWK